jgi:hypothetical protein
MLLTGFGIRTVRSLAKLTYAEHMKFIGNIDWTPSNPWCYFFLTKVCGWTLRRITSQGRVDQPMTDKQSKLLNSLMDTLAIDLADGVSPQLMMASDEFGINLFPQGDYTYDEQGCSHVLMDVMDDKRAITANIVHSASGALVTYHLTFQGTTERSLPTRGVRASIENNFNVTWGYSSNHWSNLNEKKRMIEATVEYRKKVIEKWVSDGVFSRDQAERAPMVHILDCWSVNLSTEFREWVKNTYPFIRLRYIPAGLTGKEQLNDTYFHAPCKKWCKSAAEDWYSEKLNELLLEREQCMLSQVEFDTKVEALMRLPVLRDQLVSWHEFMLRKLTEEKAATEGARPINLIKKAWSTAYKQIFDQEFQHQARERRQTTTENNAEENIAEHQLLATILLPRNGEDAPTVEQFTSELTESGLAQRRRKRASEQDTDNTDDDIVVSQEQRSLAAAREGNGSGGGDDHIASNYLLWTKETLRKAIINAGYTGSGVRNKVLPTKEVLQNLYRTHVLAAVAAAPPPPVLPPPTYTPRSCNVAEDSHHETDESESERDNTIEHFVVENSSSDDSASLTTKRARYDENTLK